MNEFHGIGICDTLYPLVRKLVGWCGDLWDCKCVVFNSGEINEVLERLWVCESLHPMAQKSTTFRRNLWMSLSSISSRCTRFFFIVSSMFSILDLLVNVSYVFVGLYLLFHQFVIGISYFVGLMCVGVKYMYVVSMFLASLLFDVCLKIWMFYVSQVLSVKIFQASTKCLVLVFMSFGFLLYLVLEVLEVWCIIWSWKFIVYGFGCLMCGFLSFRTQIICWSPQCGLFNDCLLVCVLISSLLVV
jgi:hypothetical protein